GRRAVFPLKGQRCDGRVRGCAADAFMRSFLQAR
ncbi:MAG: hypothetical protein ACJA1L_001612, partial [Paracoccaceae bacterium]